VSWERVSRLPRIGAGEGVYICEENICVDWVLETAGVHIMWLAER
jgi:hypothetical protein